MLGELAERDLEWGDWRQEDLLIGCMLEWESSDIIGDITSYLWVLTSYLKPFLQLRVTA